jgi:hypothetical protein
MARILSAIFISFMLLTSGTYAISMGSLLRNGVDSIGPDESARFSIMFWNVGSDTFEVLLTPRIVPDGWTVVIEPNDLHLNSSSGDMYISLPYQSNPAKATTVNVVIKPPYYAPTGKYNFTVTGATKYPGSDVGFSQERAFNLAVDLVNPVTFENHSQDASTSAASAVSEGQNITSMAVRDKDAEDASYLYMSVILMIILFSLLVYKYS